MTAQTGMNYFFITFVLRCTHQTACIWERPDDEGTDRGACSQYHQEVPGGEGRRSSLERVGRGWQQMGLDTSICMYLGECSGIWCQNSPTKPLRPFEYY